jgi:hypothetical protein
MRKTKTRRRKANPEDDKCRPSCIHFNDGWCVYGTALVYAEDGAPCLGKKEEKIAMPAPKKPR